MLVPRLLLARVGDGDRSAPRERARAGGRSWPVAWTESAVSGLCATKPVAMAGLAARLALRATKPVALTGLAAGANDPRSGAPPAPRPQKTRPPRRRPLNRPGRPPASGPSEDPPTRAKPAHPPRRPRSGAHRQVRRAEPAGCGDPRSQLTPRSRTPRATVGGGVPLQVRAAEQRGVGGPSIASVAGRVH